MDLLVLILLLLNRDLEGGVLLKRDLEGGVLLKIDLEGGAGGGLADRDMMMGLGKRMIDKSNALVGVSSRYPFISSEIQQNYYYMN
jgi:hypothetical protein